MSWLLTRGRIPFLCALLAATAWLGLHASRVEVETDNASLDSRNPAQVDAYERFRATFGSDEDLLLAVRHPRLLEGDGLRFLAALRERIAALPGVRHVYDLTNAQQIVAGEAGAEMAPLVEPPLDRPDGGVGLRAALDRNPDFTGLFVSADRRTAGMLIELADRPVGDRDPSALIDALRVLLAEQDGRDGVELHLTGIAVQKHDVSRYIERDQRVLMPLAVGVLGGILALFFRSALGVALPLAVTGITLAATIGAYQLAGLRLNAITSLLPPVLMVLSLAVSVHLIQGWLDAGEPDRLGRIRAVVRELRFPCFFCSLTTALGFASLATSDTPAVVQFGLFAALGVMISFAIGMTLVPVGLSFLAVPAAPLRSPQHRWMRRLLAWAADTATQRPGAVLLAFGAITTVALAGLPRVRNNTDLVRFLGADAPLRRDTLFIDAHLTGPNTLEYVVARRDGAPLASLDGVRRLAAFEGAILAHEEVSGVASIVAVLRQLQRAESGGDALVLPADERSAAYAFDLLEAAPEQDLIRKLLAPDFRQARFSVRVHAVGTAVAAPLADALLADGRRALGDDYELVATGAYEHVAQDSNRLVASQVSSITLAIGTVFLAIGALFRSARLTLVALVPNVMPILWTGGLMGFAGIDLSTGTAMIASSVLGVVVDDTIHYLACYQRVGGTDTRAALRRTTTGIGAALLLNNLILVLGYWVGCFGSFKPTAYFSLLSGVTMISGIACDLLVTPACLLLFGPRREGTA